MRTAKFTNFAFNLWLLKRKSSSKRVVVIWSTGIHFKEMKAVANRQTEVGSISIQQYLKETTFIKHETFVSSVHLFIK